MSDTATLTNTNGTIGSFKESAPAPIETPQSTDIPAPVETSEASVNQNGELQNGAAQTETQQQSPQETNVSDFNLGFDEEDATAQQGAAQTQQQSQEVNWDELFKKIDRKEVAKKIGISDFALEIDDHLSRGGNAMDYLNAKAIDWDKTSDIDILKSEFSKKYYMLEPDMQEHLFQKKYGINVDDDDDIKRDKAINQKIDAAEIRKIKKEEQSKFKIPDARTPTEQDKEYTDWKSSLQQQQQQKEQANQYISNHQSVKDLMQSKRVAIPLGENVKAFNFNLDKPELVMKAINDGSFWSKLITNEKGELNVDKLIRITTYAFNPDKHDKDIFNYGKSYGVHDLVEEGQNAKRPDGRSVIPTGVTMTEAFEKNAKTGKIGNHWKSR